MIPIGSDKCVLCGDKDATTSDHIPPRGLFLPDVRQDLISVPSCAACNNGASEDDEYFRNIVSTLAGAGSHPEARRLFEGKIRRSLNNPHQRAFWDKIRNQLTQIPIHTTGGIYLGHFPAYEFKGTDVQRIKSVITRIVRGLYWKSTNTILPKECDVAVELPDKVSQLNGEVFEYLLSIDRTQIGKRVFSYSCHLLTQSPHASIWMLLFYDAIPFLCLTNKSGLLSKEIGALTSIRS